MDDQDFNDEFEQAELEGAADAISEAIMSYDASASDRIRATIAALGYVIAEAIAAGEDDQIDLIADLGSSMAAAIYGITKITPASSEVLQ